MSIAANYWQHRYTNEDSIEHHAIQNGMIATDFIRIAKMHPIFVEALKSPRVIEVGCGTGELAGLMREEFDPDVIYATDFSLDVVKVAQERHPRVGFWVHDVLKDPMGQKFDLAISSNTLEHFRDPHQVIERMFQLAPKVLLIVPYAQPVTDDYDEEGGAGHVFEFNHSTFDPYVIACHFVFRTKGWQHSSRGEMPLQLAVVLSERK